MFVFASIFFDQIINQTSEVNITESSSYVFTDVFYEFQTNMEICIGLWIDFEWYRICIV